MAQEEQLTAEKLQYKLDRLKEFYSQRNANMLGWRDYYFRDPHAIFLNNDGEYVEPEKDEVRVVLPMATADIESYKELLLTKAPAISVPRPAMDMASAGIADHNEKTLLAVVERTGAYERTIEATHHGLVDGWGVFKVVWNPNYDEDNFPLVLLSPDPMNVYALPDVIPGTWKYVIHSYNTTAGALKKDWVYGKNKRFRKNRIASSTLEKLDDTQEVTLIDYWDEEINALAISYEVVSKGRTSENICEYVKEPTPHNYGFLPWVIFFPDPLPYPTVGERMGVSRMWFSQELIPYMSQAFSEKATYVRRHLNPPGDEHQ
jgi:hypothetical protein